MAARKYGDVKARMAATQPSGKSSGILSPPVANTIKARPVNTLAANVKPATVKPKPVVKVAKKSGPGPAWAKRRFNVRGQATGFPSKSVKSIVPTSIPGPSQVDVYRASYAPRYVVGFLFIAFTIRVVSGYPYLKVNNGKIGKGEGLLQAFDKSNVIGFVFLLAILITMAEIQVTSELAVAFAFLVLIVVLISEKNVAFDVITVFAPMQTKLAKKEAK